MTALDRLTRRQHSVYRALERAAAEGAPCPSNHDLLDVLAAGSSISAPAEIVGKLEALGLIAVERTRNSRRVTIVATGQSTAPITGRPACQRSGGGAELADRIEARARELGIPVHHFIAPLAKEVGASWLSALRRALRPKRHTIERVEALLAGSEIPALPKEVHRVRARQSSPDPGAGPEVDESRRVNRDPCPRCGVRADIGCRHSARSLRVGYAGFAGRA